MWFLALLLIPGYFWWRNVATPEPLGTGSPTTSDLGNSPAGIAQANTRGSGTGSALPPASPGFPL